MKLRLILLLAFLSLPLLPASAQELMKSSAKPASDPPETNVAERVRVLESELERQNTKLDQLQKTLVEQQQTIQALIEKLSAKTAARLVCRFFIKIFQFCFGYISLNSIISPYS